MPLTTGDPYLVVSADGHVGPTLNGDLRPYCPARHLDEYDAYAREAARDAQRHSEIYKAERARAVGTQRALGVTHLDELYTCEGLHDASVRLAEMDADGIAAEVIFAGGQNDEPLPFMGMGFSAGPTDVAPELRELGDHIFNQWMVDFVAGAPERLLGVAQIPIWDPQAAVREVQWAREHGLRVANLPAPRSDFPAYTDESYEPLWAACADLEMALATHAGGGEPALGSTGRRGDILNLTESHWLGRRGLWQLIFGGVFERHPSLSFTITEQRVDWLPETLRHLDSVYEYHLLPDDPADSSVLPGHTTLKYGSSIAADPADPLPRRPSEYWASNCFLSGSFLAPYEAAMRHEVGLGTLMWGSDYPHVEGTWPYTRLAMRNTFAGLPEPDVRAILGENALRAYHLEPQRLAAIARAIGPTPAELSTPVPSDEVPVARGLAWRTHAAFS